MKYDINYFINKFEGINEDLWCMFYIGTGSRHCVLGHCGTVENDYDYILSKESKALIKIFGKVEIIYRINDFHPSTPYKQPTPKDRILAALYDIRDKEIQKANIKEAKKIVNKPISELV